MKIKVFYPNEKGNIELTKEKLETILTEAYNEGYHDGRNSNGYYYGGLAPTTPYVTSRTNVSSDLVSTALPQYDKALAIDCCLNANDAVTTDVLNSTITIEYGEVTNEN